MDKNEKRKSYKIRIQPCQQWTIQILYMKAKEQYAWLDQESRGRMGLKVLYIKDTKNKMKRKTNMKKSDNSPD